MSMNIVNQKYMLTKVLKKC